MTGLWGVDLSPEEIVRRVGSMSQIAGAQAYELTDGNERGVRGVRLYNAAGLDLDVITDRGMSITRLTWKGVPLNLLTPTGTVHPAYAEPYGMGWLRTWPAGFLTTCGLTQVGRPALDGDEQLGIHGRAANLPASQARWGGDWRGKDFQVWVEGTLRDVAVFGNDLSLHRRVWMSLAEARFWIEDRVVNEGFAPAPHMFLQHFNLGFPLVSAQTRLVLPEGSVEPRDDDARPGLAQCKEFHDPTRGYREQVFYHDLSTDAQGMVAAELHNPAFDGGKGLKVTWKYRKADFPLLVEWKMMGEGLYVVGVEPGNCHVEGRVRERERGSLQVLAPHEERSYRIEIDFAQDE